MAQSTTLKRSQVSLARRILNTERVTALLMITPSIIAIAVFVYGFIGWTAFVSMTKWNTLLPDYTWVGLENYRRIFQDVRFQADIRNTIVFTAVFITGCLVIGLGLAILLDQRIRGENTFRSIYLFPMALSLIVTGTIWRWIFFPGNYPTDPAGINLILAKVGLEEFQWGWITDPTIWPGIRPAWLKVKLMVPLALLPMTIAAIWQMSGFTMAMYLAGLRGIPEELKEAARVDGASEWQIFRLIELPMLRPITLSAVIILGHFSLKVFDLVMAMTGGGPAFATDMPGVNMYYTVFQGNAFAKGSAIAMIMLILVAMLIVPYLYYNRQEEM